MRNVLRQWTDAECDDTEFAKKNRLNPFETLPGYHTDARHSGVHLEL